MGISYSPDNPFATGQKFSPDNPFAENADPNAKLHADYKSGALQKRNARLNANDTDMAAAETPSLGARIGGNLANLIRDVPGGEALTAGAHSLLSGQPYRQSVQDVRDAEATTPNAVRIPSRLVGGAVAASAMPGSLAMQGARYGASSGLLQANPDASIGDRVKDAAVSGVTGLALGKGLDLGGTALRALNTPKVAANIVGRIKDRASVADPLYEQFRQLGDLGHTPALAELIGTPNAKGAITDGLPIIRRAIEAVKGESPILNKLPDTDARVLHAVYQRVGNKAFTATHGFESGEARTALLSAIDDAAKAKGGSYADAVSAFRGPSQEIAAVNRGALALKNTARASGTPSSQVAKTSPEAVAEWAQGATPGQLNAAQEGILGQLHQSPFLDRVHLFGANIPVPFPSRALRGAGPLLQSIGRPSNTPTLSQLLNAMTLGAGTPTP